MQIKSCARVSQHGKENVAPDLQLYAFFYRAHATRGVCKSLAHVHTRTHTQIHAHSDIQVYAHPSAPTHPTRES